MIGMANRLKQNNQNKGPRASSFAIAINATPKTTEAGWKMSNPTPVTSFSWRPARALQISRANEAEHVPRRDSLDLCAPGPEAALAVQEAGDTNTFPSSARTSS